jgi:tripartite-type tricarboxylate transporter receptor subunit TctC
MTFRSVVLAASLAAFGCTSLFTAAAAQAQSYPNKPIKMLTGFTAGGVTDLLGRAIAERMAAGLGQPVVLDARPGAGGIIGTDAAIKSDPDGYTIGLIVSPTIIGAMVNGREWKLESEMTPLGLAYRQGYMIGLNPTVAEFQNVKNMMDLVKVVKTNPGKIFFASVGAGSTGHLTGELIKGISGLDWTHVPYKGMQGGLLEVISGRTPLVMFGTDPDDPKRHVGRVINIASSALTRNKTTPDVPTLSESGFPDMDASTWAGFFAPAGLPKPIADRLQAEYKAAWEHPETQKRLSSSLVLEYMPPAEFMTLMRKTVSVWGKVIKDQNIKPQ